MTKSKEEAREYAKEYYHKNKVRIAIERKEYHRTHKEQAKIYNKKYREEHPYEPENEERTRRRGFLSILRKYGITQSQYVELHTKQNGRCAVCEEMEVTIGKKGNSPVMLSVDHNHITGKIRGLLCKKCNLGIGYLKDDPNVLLSARNYLLSNN